MAYQQDDPTIEYVNEARETMGFQRRMINSPQLLKELQRVYGLDIVTKNGKVVFNDDGGLINLEEVLQNARTSIPYKKTNVQKLIHDPELKRITGLLIDEGKYVDTTDAFIFVTAGAWTPKLLQDAGNSVCTRGSTGRRLVQFPCVSDQRACLEAQREAGAFLDRRRYDLRVYVILEN